MADPAPSAEQIISVAREIQRLASRNRGRELGYYERDAITDEQYHQLKDDHQLPGMITGGTSADYAALDAEYAWIPDMFARAVGPEPSGFDGSIRSMRDAENAICDMKVTFDLTDVGDDRKVRSFRDDGPAIDTDYMTAAENARNEIVEWKGTAADTFRTNFLGRIPAVTANQTRVAKALRFALATNKQLYELGRKDLLEVANKTKAALDFSGGCGGPDLVVVMGVAAGVCTIAAGIAALPAGGVAGGLTIGAGVATTIQTVAGISGDGKKAEFTIEAGTVATTLASCCDAVSKIQECISAGEDAIIDALKSAHSVVAGSRELFLAPRPAIIDVAKRPASGLWAEVDL